MTDFTPHIYNGDCLDVMAGLPKNSVDLIVTSPPYADARQTSYGGTAPDDYNEWFLPRTKQMLRVLKPSGSFVLNIKEKVVDGERHTYVLELILELKKQGWLWIEQYMWHKKNTAPGRWKNRLRDAWEHCLHFSSTKDIKWFPGNVREPVLPHQRNKYRREVPKAPPPSRKYTASGSRYSRKPDAHNANLDGYRFPSNVLYLPVESKKHFHAAPFPPALPSFFINLLTETGDVVLDPFLGSGTTYRAALTLNRIPLGIELSEDYIRKVITDPYIAGDVDLGAKKAPTRPTQGALL